MGTEVGWDNDEINKWVVRCMEQLRVWAEVGRGRDGMEKGTGMHG